jgi:hypothetical protein
VRKKHIKLRIKMKKTTLALCALNLLLFNLQLQAQVTVKPDHVVFVLEENYARTEIIGSSSAPTLTALSIAPTTCNFTAAYAITHPSEPNYLDLFSGTNHGVIADLVGPASNAPFNDCNLASALIQKGYTFTGYAEDQPSVGWTAGDVGNYVTKHCPWINWVNGDNGASANIDSIPINDILPMFPLGTYFPDSNSYSSLPTVSWVIPNQVDDMHNPSSPASTAISNGDKWFKTNMMPLVRWAANPVNNTLVIVIWDEDDGTQSNNIPLMFCGGIVQGGTCATHLTHYDILKTVEDMYGLTLCGSAATGTDVPSNVFVGISNITGPISCFETWPVPAKEELSLRITSKVVAKVNIGMYDVSGRMVKEISKQLIGGDNNLIINTEDVSNGMYFVNITGDGVNISRKVEIAK